jgi:arsenate reductase
VSESPIGDIDTVITLCGEENLALLPGELARESWSLPDLAMAAGPQEQSLAVFRALRDEIRRRLEAFVGSWT